MGTKAVVVGMSERDSFALSLLIRRMYPEWLCESAAPAAPDTSGDFYVLDADAWRECHGPQQAASRLDALLGGKPAVLVTAPVPLRDEARAQAAADATAWEQCGWVVVRRPYGAAEMIEALEAAVHRAQQVSAASSVAPVAEVPKPTSPKAMAPEPGVQSSAQRVQPPRDQAPLRQDRHAAAPGPVPAPATEPATEPAAPQAVASELGEQELTLLQFQACIATSPLPECRQFLGTLAERLARPGAFELSFTLINGLIFGPRRQVVASNTPLSVLRMVARSRTLGSFVGMTDIHEEFDMPQRAAQRGMQLYPLGVLLHALARMADCRLPDTSESA